MTEQKLTLQVTRHFDFPAEKVFDAWLNPSAVGKWLFHAPGGEMKKIEIEPRVGGKYEIAEQREDDYDRHVGEYLVIDRPKKLVFTFAYVGPKIPDAPSTKVTVDIQPTDDGCILTLTHEGVLPDWGEQTTQGWTMILDNLAATLGGE
jgi:uncharacterized protein YndB with AHSA1/START domain